MSDDDLDLDLDDEPVAPARPVKPAKPLKPAPAAKTAPAEPKAAKAVGARAPGVVDRAREYVKHPKFTGRTFLTILIVLVILVVLGENIAPVRFYLFGIVVELPKAIAFLLDVAIGAGLMWLWLRRPAAKPAEAGK